MKILISKLLTDTITEEELLELYDWLKDPDNQKVLEEYVQDDHDLNLAMIRNDVNAAYHKVIGQIEKEETPVRILIPNWTKYAAAILVFAGISYLFSEGFFPWMTDDDTLRLNEDFITLELEDGSIETINLDAIKDIRNASGTLVGKQSGNTLTYRDVGNSDKLIYNTLRVPYGKRFGVELSDGTQVFLNSGTSLRYPANFLEGQEREVFVVGEAYFDVTTDTEHPFIVKAEGLNVMVLGTQFNVSSYLEDATTDVVLVEGRVSLYDDEATAGNATLLTPGLRGSFNKSAKSIRTAEVNTLVYTSWRNGELVFRNTPFKNILKKLERHYNITIELDNEELGEELFSASFTDKSIEMVLGYFNDISRMDYTIHENTIYIE